MEAVAEFRAKQARRLSITHARGKAQIGTTRTSPGHGPALPIRPPVVAFDLKALSSEPEVPPLKLETEAQSLGRYLDDRRLLSLEAQVRRLFADTEGNRKAVASINDALVKVEADLRSGKSHGPVRRVLLRVLGFMPAWL